MHHEEEKGRVQGDPVLSETAIGPSTPSTIRDGHLVSLGCLLLQAMNHSRVNQSG